MPGKNKKSKTRYPFSIRTKITLIILISSWTVALLMMWIGSNLYRSATIDHYYDVGLETTKNVMALFAEGELENYAKNLRAYKHGELSEDDASAIRESTRYRDIHREIANMRKNMIFNDIYVAVYDTELLRNPTNDTSWQPIYYMFDSYRDTSKEYTFGSSSRIGSKYAEAAANMWDTGKITGEKVVTTGSFGYIMTIVNPYQSDGKTVAVVSVEISMDMINQYLITFNIALALATLVLTTVLCILIGIYCSKRIVTPIETVASEAEEFIRNNTEVSDKLDRIRTHDEIEHLSRNLMQLELDTRSYINNLTSVTAEKERIGAELNLATQIQADMLPSIFPAFPGRKEFDIYATMHPAKEVGGDFYDFFLIDSDHLGLVIADVSGKGVPAALFMVIAKTLIKNHAQLGEYSPAKVLASANTQLCEGNEAELFVTVWLAVLELSTGKGKAANAGHEHPVLCHKDGTFELVEYPHSPPVATMEGMRFREHDFQLLPGDKLFVYTDGVPEATNEHNELFGTDRMLAALNSDTSASPREILGNVKQAVDDFVGDAMQFDDITMLGFSYYGSEGQQT